MKKSIKFFLLILWLCPIILLSACGTTTYYSIFVSPSDSVLGSVLGTLSNTTQVEGTTMSLTARENNSSTNPFICWIKDNSTVVSTDINLNLTYNSQNAGRYTALFEETSPNSMMYTAVDSITFQIPTNTTSISFELKYYRASSGSEQSITLESGQLTTSNIYNSNHNSLLYLGSVGTLNSYQYRLSMDITLIDNSGRETIYSLTGQTTLDNTAFNRQQSVDILLEDSISNTQIVISFVKLTKNLFSENI